MRLHHPYRPPRLRSDDVVQLGMVALAKRLSLPELLRFRNGLLRRDQALAAGLSRTAVDGHVRYGRWQRIMPTVYWTTLCRAGIDPLSSRQLVRAAWMWAGDDAVITGAAAAVWADHLDEVRLPIGLAIPPSRRLSEQPGVQVARARIDRRDITSHNGILITKSSRTAVDLAATNPHSEAERVTHRALTTAGISGWRANAELVIDGRTLRPDLAFDDVKLVVEIDGFAYHGDRDAFERDRLRQNLLTAAGWTVLRFTWRQVHEDPRAVIAQIEETRCILRMKLRLD